MPKKINYTLTTESLTSIEGAIKNHPDLRLRLRARIIRLLHLGKKPQEVADLLAIKISQVYYWHKRWRAEGLDGLSDRPRQGRPQLGDEAYRQKLEQLIEQNPQELGYAFTSWDVKQLMAHLEKETSISMSPATFYNLLAEEGYVYRRPKHTLAPLQDEAAKERAVELIEELKKSLNEPKSNYSLWTKQP